MKERFLLKLQVKDKKKKRQLQVNSLTPDGIVLRDETDATPRGMTFHFSPRGDATNYRLNRVRQLRGWGLREFKLVPFVHDGMLGFSGVDANALPKGTYEFRLQIGDLRIPGPRLLKIREDETSQVDLTVTDDPRRVELTRAISDFDPQVKRIVESPFSEVDGLDLPDWLVDGKKRARRHACLLNVLASLRTAPTKSQPLVRHVDSVFFADVDRLYVRASAGLHEQLTLLAADEKKPFYHEGPPNSATHAKLLGRVALREPDAGQYTLDSFRGEGKPSLQAVVAVPPNRDKLRTWYADLDLDLGNPLQDLAGFVIHMGELLGPGKTDHFDLGKKLMKRKQGEFLYYKIVKKG